MQPRIATYNGIGSTRGPDEINGLTS